jgi:hypothetical protein
MKVFEIYRKINADDAERIRLFAGDMADKFGRDAVRSMLSWTDDPRVKIMDTANGRIVRAATANLDKIKEAASSGNNAQDLDLPTSDLVLWGQHLPEGNGGWIDPKMKPRLKLAHKFSYRGGEVEAIDENMSDLLRDVLPMSVIPPAVREIVSERTIDDIILLGFKPGMAPIRKSLSDARDGLILQLGDTPIRLGRLEADVRNVRDVDYQRSLENYGFLA